MPFQKQLERHFLSFDIRHLLSPKLLSDGTELIRYIRCMKKAGMSIKDIRQYIELSMQGDDTIDTRLEMFRHQREVLTRQIQQLQHTLETVEYKCWFYETAKAAGTVDVPSAMTDADVPEERSTKGSNPSLS